MLITIKKKHYPKKNHQITLPNIGYMLCTGGGVWLVMERKESIDTSKGILRKGHTCTDLMTLITVSLFLRALTWNRFFFTLFTTVTALFSVDDLL